MAEGQTLAAIAGIIVAAIGAAVAVIALQILGALFYIGMLQIIGVNTEPVMGVAAAQELVDLIHGNKLSALGLIALGGGEDDRLTLQISESLQNLFRAVKMITQNVPIHLISGKERADLIYKGLQAFGLF